MRRVLILGTYPIKNPIHGGQRRTEAIQNFYKKHLGLKNVKYIAVYNPHAYHEAAKDDIAVGPATLKKITAHNFAEDVICGQAIIEDPLVRKKIERILEKFNPDTIQFEQAYPYLGFKKLTTEARSQKLKLIYSSHNVEYKMKEEIYSNLAIDSHEANKYLKLIKDNEQELAKSSEFVIAVSEDDKRKIESMTDKNVVVAPNGVSELHPDVDSVEYWHKYFRSKGIVKSAVFIGSAHPPNAHGLEEMVLNKIGFLPPDSKVFVIGGVCDLIRQEHTGLTINDILYQQRTELLGKLDESRKDGLIAACDVVLLPITQGGGSNLKTAEAILSGKKVVATEFAMRSFDSFVAHKRIRVARNPEEFKKAILEQFNQEEPEVSRAEQDQSRLVTWEECLKPISEVI
jgi:hypothetical protein